MHQDYFASVTIDEIHSAFKHELFGKTMELIPSGIQLLRPIFGNDKNIIDFAIIYNNKSAITADSLEKISDIAGRRSDNYKTLIADIIVGKPFSYAHEEKLCVLSYVVTPLADGVLLIYDEADENLSHAEKKIHELNIALIQKNRALESINSEVKTFNSIAVNDYKETLQKLYTNLEYILTTDAANLSDSGKGNLRKMQASIQKMKLLTEDLISFSKLQTLDEVLACVDLNQVLRIAKKDLTDKIGETNGSISSDELPAVSGYPLLLSLLFFHLLDNAIKFRSLETVLHIKVSYRRVGVPSEKKGVVADTHYHRISVVDNGIGFDPGETENLFNMFYRVEGKKKYKGSGIGLSVCKKIMALHNGYMTAESTVAGASFHCFFPE